MEDLPTSPRGTLPRKNSFCLLHSALGFTFPVLRPGLNLPCEWFFFFPQTHTPRTHVYFRKEEESFQALLRVKGRGEGMASADRGPFHRSGRAPRAAANTNAGGSEPAQLRPRSSLRSRRPALAPLCFLLTALESQAAREPSLPRVRWGGSGGGEGEHLVQCHHRDAPSSAEP